MRRFGTLNVGFVQIKCALQVKRSHVVSFSLYLRPLSLYDERNNRMKIKDIAEKGS